MYLYNVHTLSSLNHSETKRKTKKKNKNLTVTRNIWIVNKHDNYFSYSVKCSIEDNRSSTSSDEITRIRPKSILKLAK